MSGTGNATTGISSATTFLDPQQRAIRGRWFWTMREPAAVALIFPSPRGQVTWWFARDLLTAGVQGRAGEGDVALIPDPRKDLLFVRLCSPDGQVTLSCGLQVAALFLRETLELCPVEVEEQIVAATVRRALVKEGWAR